MSILKLKEIDNDFYFQFPKKYYRSYRVYFQQKTIYSLYILHDLEQHITFFEYHLDRNKFCLSNKNFNNFRNI